MAAPTPFAIHRTQSREGIALALSGGGYRAMLFHTGALIRLNELGLLWRVKRVSSVSGGSLSAAYLGVAWRRLTFENGVAQNFQDEYVNPILEFSRRTIDRAGALIGLFTQGLLVSRRMTSVYRRYLFGDATLQNLPEDGAGPRFILCASNLSTGSLWRFSRPYMADWRLGRILNPDVSLATAVAASAGFPPLLSPVRLHLKPCRFVAGDAPPPDHDVTIFHPIPDKCRRRAVLCDGGVYDNHGLQPVEDWPSLLVSDGGMPHAVISSGLWNWYSQTRRVLDVMDNQVRSLRRRDLIRRFQVERTSSTAEPQPSSAGRATRGAYWGVGTNPDVYKQAGGLACDPIRVSQLARVGTRLMNFGDEIRSALVNWGYAISDKSLRTWYNPRLPQPPDWPLPGGLGPQAHQ